MSKDDLVLVRFTVPNSPYVGGEQAGFKRALAGKLVSAGKAVYLNAEDAPVSKSAPESAEETGALSEDADQGKDESSDEKPTPKASKKKTKKRGGLFGGS